MGVEVTEAFGDPFKSRKEIKNEESPAAADAIDESSS